MNALVSDDKNEKSLFETIVRFIENSAILITLFFIVFLPALDMFAQNNFLRSKGLIGIEGSSEYLKHLMIWFTMLGATISSREKQHISLAVFDILLPKKLLPLSHFFVATTSATVLLTFGFAAFDHFSLVSEGEMVNKIPQMVFTMAFPVGFGIMALRAVKQDTIWRSIASFIIGALIPMLLFGVPTTMWEWIIPFMEDKASLVSSAELTLSLWNILYGVFVLLILGGSLYLGYKGYTEIKSGEKRDGGFNIFRAIVGVLVFIALPKTLSSFYVEFADVLVRFNDWIEPLRWEYPKAIFTTLFILLLIATTLGTPIFVTLAGFAALLFFQSEQMLGYLPNEAYEVLTDDIFPTIPLFTIAGFILSESKSGERLVAFFKSLIGWMPGGLAIMAVLVSAFFTTFTGASGVTILALGGLLHYIMTKEGYKAGFTEGYLTASGSIGLLFAPSLPIILYGVQAQISIKELFAGGFVPGIVLILTLSLYAIFRGAPKTQKKRDPFSIKKVGHTFKSAAPEVMLPFVIIALFFTGNATLLQTSVIAVIYMLVTNLFIHKDFKLKDIPAVILKAAPIAGAVLIILASAKGLSYFIVDAQIPQELTAWVSERLDPSDPSSRIILLLILNVALLITGCFMDIFSAIMVVVPLILPLGAEFGIGPVHLGIVFLANLELGYLTPPVGMNLFLAALRFEKPLVKIYRSVLPFLGILLVAVLIITYIPAVTYSGLHALGFTTENEAIEISEGTLVETFAEVDTVVFENFYEVRTTESERYLDTTFYITNSVVDRQIFDTQIDSSIVIERVEEINMMIDTIMIDTLLVVPEITVDSLSI